MNSERDQSFKALQKHFYSISFNCLNYHKLKVLLCNCIKIIIQRYKIKNYRLKMTTAQEPPQEEDAAELTFPKEFEDAETLLISEVENYQFKKLKLNNYNFIKRF